MPSHCCVPLCNGCGGHTFPAKQELREKWVDAIRRDKFTPSKSSVVCRKHFHSDQYVQETIYGGIPAKKQLKAGAVPCIFKWKPPPVRPRKVRVRHSTDHKAPEKTVSTKETPVSDNHLMPIFDIEIASEDVCDLQDSDGELDKMIGDADNVQHHGSTDNRYFCEEANSTLIPTSWNHSA